MTNISRDPVFVHVQKTVCDWFDLKILSDLSSTGQRLVADFCKTFCDLCNVSAILNFLYRDVVAECLQCQFEQILYQYCLFEPSIKMQFLLYLIFLSKPTCHTSIFEIYMRYNILNILSVICVLIHNKCIFFS